MTSLTLQLPDDVSAQLAAAGREAHRSPEEIAADLIRRALLAQRFGKVRESILKSLGNNAPETDEDAFGLLS